MYVIVELLTFLLRFHLFVFDFSFKASFSMTADSKPNSCMVICISIRRCTLFPPAFKLKRMSLFL